MEWYQRYRSDVILKETRLKKLDKIYVQELLKLKEMHKKREESCVSGSDAAGVCDRLMGGLRKRASFFITK